MDRIENKRKRPSRKIIMRRRVVFFSVVTILIIVLGLITYNFINSINNRSYRQKFHKNYSMAQLQQLEEKLQIKGVAYEWNRDLEEGNKPEKIIIHHTASSNLTPEKINQMHIDKGWSGIGYHFYIRANGTIYRGREENVIGSHAKGNNYNTLGICLEGNFEDDEPTKEQLNALVALSTYLSLKYDIRDIIRHCDVVDTLCPGGNFPYDSVKESIINTIEAM